MENFTDARLGVYKMEQNINNGNGEKIRKVIFNEVSLIISVIAIGIGCVLFITGPDAELQQDIALIRQDITIMKTNELPHIQARMDEAYIKTEQNEDKIIEINLKLERIIVLLERY